MEKSEQERIEKAADHWFASLAWIESYKIPLSKTGYIAGATAENERYIAALKEYTDLLEDLQADKLELVLALQEFIEAMQAKRSLIDTIEKAQALIAKHSPK